VLSPWFGAGEGEKAILEIERPGQPVERIEVEAPTGLYTLEIEEVGRSICRRESPAMPWADSLGNAVALDRWRQAVGVSYETERPEGKRSPRLSLAPPGSRRIERVALPGLAKPVSRLVMGGMSEGGVFKIAHGFALLDYFFELGGNCIDTAFIYAGGRADQVIGDWMKTRGAREETVLLVKGAHTPFCDPQHLTEQLLISLERLQTDYADAYMLHRDNPDIPAGEFVDVLNEHARAGRIRLFGGSNWTRERVDEANAYARAHGLQGFSVLSNNLSLARMVNPIWGGCLSAKGPEWQEWLQREKIAQFAWSSQARGFFARGDRDFTSDADLVHCWYSDDNFERLRRVRELAAKKGTEPVQIAAAWVLDQPFLSFALIGPQTLAEIRSCARVGEITLTPEERAWLDLAS
jgi:aryl-alcohol dehydrogenase-like predicted oxidoreductase